MIEFCRTQPTDAPSGILKDENTAPADVWVDDAVIREGADEDDLDVKQQRCSLSGNGVCHGVE